MIPLAKDESADFYKESRDLSWEVLLRNHVTKLPVPVEEICANEKVHVHSFAKAQKIIQILGLKEQTLETDGYSFLFDGCYYILYNDTLKISRQRYTIAHELGHCLLDHLEKMGPNAQIKRMEAQSNRFAAELLAPACVLWGIRVKSAEEIAKICDISTVASEIRMERMQTLYARNDAMQRKSGHGCFLLSPVERSVFAQFGDYIVNYRNENNRSAGPQGAAKPVSPF